MRFFPTKTNDTFLKSSQALHHFSVHSTADVPLQTGKLFTTKAVGLNLSITAQGNTVKRFAFS